MASSGRLLEIAVHQSSSRYLLESQVSILSSENHQELSAGLEQKSQFRSSSSDLQIQAIPEPNNSLSQPYNLGVLSGDRTFSDFVGNSDIQDIYRFTLSTTSSFNLSLNGLTADADIHLIKDINSNQVIDPSDIIQTSEFSGTVVESILVDPLAAGTYYLRVFRYSGNTNYNLNLSATAVVDNSLNTATNVGNLTASRTFNNFVGTTDTQDFYRFNITNTSNFNLSLRGLTANADVQLIRDSNNNGAVDINEVIAASEQLSNRAESLLVDPLAAGTYYVRVYQSNGNTNYNLQLTATTVGDNILNTAHNIGFLTAKRTFSDFVGTTDTQDFYRFNIRANSNFNLSLTNLTADADVQLIQDSNSNNLVDVGEVIDFSATPGTRAESLIFDPMTPGTYYLRVYQVSGNTNYNLSLSATAVVNNTLSTANNVGILNTRKALTGFVRSTDTQNFYRFSLSNVSNLNIALNNLTANADLELIRDINSNGIVDPGEELRTSQLSGTAAETINYLGLAAGTYYVRVYQSSGNTNYNLTLAPSFSDGFNSDYGYGLVNASAAISRALGRSIPNVANLGGNNWGLDLVNAPEAWAQGYTGQGIVVAVVDSGVDYNHNDLNVNIWRNSAEIVGNGLDDDGNGFIDDIRGWDFVNADNNPMDLNDHGTHVAGAIAAEKNGLGVTGVAYNAKIMPVRVLDASGFGSSGAVAAGIRYAANNKADVINLSLGGSYSSEIEAAVSYATLKGSVVVIAAGNEGSSEPSYPARHAIQSGIAVGAVDSSKNMPFFSNRAGNTKMDYVVAPGVDIRSTTPNNTYELKSGTSMATPYVAGVAALLLSAKKSLTPAQVENILTATANSAGITV